MVRGIIYKWTNKINHKCYIGKTINEYQRIIQHRNSKTRDHFHQAIRKYGIENFEYEVIFNIISNDRWRINYILNILEKYFIKKYNSYYKGYNSTLGGDGNNNPHLPEEWKKNISKSLIGNTRRKGKKFSEEQRLKLRYRSRGVMTEDGKNRIREKLNKKVYQYTLDGEFVAHFNSVIDAEKSLNSTMIKRTGIAACCRGERKTAYGYKWSYDIDQNTINNKDNANKEGISDENN